MAVRDIIARIVTKFDRTSANQTEAEAKKTLSSIEAGAKRIGAAMVAAFSVGAIVAFGKSSVRAAMESEAIWNRVSGAVERTGTKWTAVEKKVRATADALRDVAGVDDDKFAEGFDTLLATTGDVNLALSQMGFLADVAARFFGGDLAAAAETLGKIFSGNTKIFRSFGIVTDDVNEGLRILRERAEGAAENEMQTLQGRMEQMTIAAEDLKKEFGFVALRLAGGSDSIEVSANRARLGLDKITEWVSRIKGIRMVGPIPWLLFNPKEKDAPADPTAGIAQLDPIIALAKDGKAKDSKPDDPGLIHQARNAARAAMEDAEKFRRRALERARQERRSADPDEAFTFEAADEWAKGLDDNSLKIDELTDKFENELGPAAMGAAYGVANAWQDTFTLLLSGAGTIGSVFETLARGIAGSMLGGLAQYAGGKVAENTALAVEEVAKGLAAASNPLLAWSAPGHFAAASKFGSAVALWSVVAGSAGAGQSAVTRGGGVSGGVPSGAVDIGGRIADRTELGSQTIVYVSGFNPADPVHVRRLGQGMQRVSATDSSIDVRPWDGRTLHG